MTALIAKTPIEITNRLADLGWKVDDLLEIVSAMVRARNGCTDNHPAAAAGWMSWAEGIRRMREIGLSKGLSREDMDNIPWTFDKKRGIRFAVANTDDGTAQEKRIPQNRSKKGAATDRAVDRNQTSIFDYISEGQVRPISKVISHPGIIVSWYLCVFSEGDVVRAEMSCPIITEAGFFADFAERIFLIGHDPSDGILRRKNDDNGGGEYEISVIRKR